MGSLAVVPGFSAAEYWFPSGPEGGRAMVGSHIGMDKGAQRVARFKYGHLFTVPWIWFLLGTGEARATDGAYPFGGRRRIPAQVPCGRACQGRPCRDRFW